MLAVSTHKPVTTWTNTWATPRWQLGDSVDDHIWPFCSFVVRGVNIALVMWSKAAVCRGIKKWLSGKIKSVVWDIIRILMLTLELVIFVMARTAWGMRSFFLLGICQHYVAWRLQSSVILWSYPCPLYIMMRAERHSPLLPSHSLSLFISAHDTPLARCHSAIPKILGGPAEEFLQADDTADLPSSWPVWVTVSFIAVSVAPQMGRLSLTTEFVCSSFHLKS